ncbi:hypothetical protein AB4084_30580, partial [Lysobacter sp. 2RAB21]
MNRTQGNPDWIVVQPLVQMPSNCIVPTAVVEKLMSWWETHLFEMGGQLFNSMCAKSHLSDYYTPPIPPGSGVSYDALTYPDTGQNHGQGFFADLSGNELPGAPRFTFSLGAQYS